MSGIYIHIPYCKTRCPYCDFFSVTNRKDESALVRALMEEISLQSGYMNRRKIHTIYFGGGTPSALKAKELQLIHDNLYKTFDVAEDAEVTIECNPDDVSPDFFRELRAIGFNRVSLGLQSFHDGELKFLGRRHSVGQNYSALQWAFKGGFENVSVDLIYGLPGSSIQSWQDTLNIAFDYPFKHLSAYHLTIEQDTVFGDLLNKGELEEIPEDVSLEQFRLLIGNARDHGFEHYELSNFAYPEYYSRHNTSYWQQIPYLGIGPSAHSYNGVTRQWNVSNIKLYRESIIQGEIPGRREHLSRVDLFNEYMITRLRTQWGLDLEAVRRKFGDQYINHLLEAAQPYMKDLYLQQSGNTLVLTDDGKFISDSIFRDLMWTE